MAKENGSKPQVPSRFTNRIQLDRTMYKPETCGDKPLVGYVVRLQDMPPIEGKAWQAFLIRTTEPTKATDREGNVIDVGVDEDVLIPATWRLLEGLTPFATDPEKMFEVFIQPKAERIKLKGRTPMWDYDLLVADRTKARTGVFVLPKSETKALPPAEGATAEEIPF